MKNLVQKFAIALLTVSLMVLGGMALGHAYQEGVAHAQANPLPEIDAGLLMGSDGSGSAITPSTTTVTSKDTVTVTSKTTHETLADPNQDPGGFVGDLGAMAQKKAWLGFILVGLYGLIRLLGKGKMYWSKLEWFDHGHPAMVIAIGGTMLASCIDAFFLGGNLMTILLAALWSLVGALGIKKPGA